MLYRSPPTGHVTVVKAFVHIQLHDNKLRIMTRSSQRTQKNESPHSDTKVLLELPMITKLVMLFVILLRICKQY